MARGKRSRQRPNVRFGPKVCDDVVAWLALGNFREAACKRAGITDRTLRRWLEKGRQELEAAEADVGPDDDLDASKLGPYARFLRRVEETEANVENGLVQSLVFDPEARPEDKRWFLERRHPKRYGKGAMRLELTGDNGGPLEVNIDARQALLSRLSSVAPDGAAEESDPQPEPG